MPRTKRLPNPRSPTRLKLHHLHAAPASSGMSFDLGPLARVRYDGGDATDKRDITQRLAVLWNMHEGIPTEVLEAGRVREFYDAVHELVTEVNAAVEVVGDINVEATQLKQLAEKVSKAWEAITIEPTADGRRANCKCSEKVEVSRGSSPKGSAKTEQREGDGDEGAVEPREHPEG